MSRGPQRGFTLVEVLIASVILFSAIAVAAVSLQTILQARKTMLDAMRIERVLPWVVDQVQGEVRSLEQLPTSAVEGRIADIDFSWQVEGTPQLSPLRQILPDGEEQSLSYSRLTDISITLRSGSASRSFSTRIWSWQRENTTPALP